jgi:hypothetical protein
MQLFFWSTAFILLIALGIYLIINTKKYRRNPTLSDRFVSAETTESPIVALWREDVESNFVVKFNEINTNVHGFLKFLDTEFDKITYKRKYSAPGEKSIKGFVLELHSDKTRMYKVPLVCIVECYVIDVSKVEIEMLDFHTQAMDEGDRDNGTLTIATKIWMSGPVELDYKESDFQSAIDSYKVVVKGETESDFNRYRLIQNDMTYKFVLDNAKYTPSAHKSQPLGLYYNMGIGIASGSEFEGFSEEEGGIVKPPINIADSLRNLINTNKGCCISIEGESGCGKSYFTNMILKQLDPDGWDIIYISSFDLHHMTAPGVTGALLNLRSTNKRQLVLVFDNPILKLHSDTISEFVSGPTAAALNNPAVIMLNGEEFQETGFRPGIVDVRVYFDTLTEKMAENAVKYISKYETSPLQSYDVEGAVEFLERYQNCYIDSLFAFMYNKASVRAISEPEQQEVEKPQPKEVSPPKASRATRRSPKRRTSRA